MLGNLINQSLPVVQKIIANHKILKQAQLSEEDLQKLCYVAWR
jgi:hypothetical protein